jgi:hypothetical protein
MKHPDVLEAAAIGIPSPLVEVVDSFPKTPSERVDKGKVRAAGLSGAAWDADGDPLL